MSGPDRTRGGFVARRLLPSLLLPLPFFLVTPASGQAAGAVQPSVATPRRDTIPRVTTRLFERRVVFSPQYLRRLITPAREAERTLAEMEAQELANSYAARYRIEPSLALQIVRTAYAEGLDPDLAFRLVRVESVFEPTARGPSGALGLTQLMPSTARAVDRSLRSESQILDPATNLRVGFRYLRRLIDRYDGNVKLGLLAYNRGEGTVDRALRAGRNPDNGYSERVLRVGGEPYTGTGTIEPRTDDSSADSPR